MDNYYGYGVLEDRLINACKRYPPDFDSIQAIIKSGADVNATKGQLPDSDETLLPEIILFYPEIESMMEHRGSKNDAPYDDSPYEGSILPADADGRYLPQIIRIFLDNGFCASGSIGSYCLRNLIFASCDAHILLAAKLLLQAGADPSFIEDGETILSSVVGETVFQACEGNHALENLYETLYQIMESYVKGTDYWGIEFYSACIGRRIDSAIICSNPLNPKRPVFNVGFLIPRYRNCFCTSLMFSCEGKPLCITRYANILVNPNEIPETPGQTQDVSGYFKDCIGHVIVSIRFGHRSVKKVMISHSQPVILIGLDNGKIVRISINHGEVPKEDMVAYFKVL